VLKDTKKYCVKKFSVKNSKNIALKNFSVKNTKKSPVIWLVIIIHNNPVLRRHSTGSICVVIIVFGIILVLNSRG